MPSPMCSEMDFVRLVEEYGITGAAGKLSISERTAHARRRRIEARLGIVIKPPSPHSPTASLETYPARRIETIEDGHILIGSDSHYWPGIVTRSHQAFVRFAKEFQPKIIIKNGDVMDFPSISRHETIGWEKRPQVSDEIETTKERLGEIEDACKNATLYWPLGNHDARFETRLAVHAPEYAKVHGVHLKDHFPRWRPCWSVWINDDVVVKHRFKNGIHAPHNNTLWSGKSIITGHLHSLKVSPLSDYNCTRWGVDCGTLSEPYGPQFVNYTEDSPVNWRSGFVLLTFHKGRLLWPEIIHVTADGVDFRGKLTQ